jgi:hypothetical protein
MIVFFIGLFSLVALISWLWANGIDNMKDNHSDYKGEDFLNEKDENGLI